MANMKLVWVLLILLLTACATGNKKPGGDGGLVIPYAVSTSDGSKIELDCRYKFKSESQIQSYSLIIKKPLSHLKLNMPADDYELVQVDCNDGQTWYAPEKREFKVTVLEGHEAVMEPLQILVSKKKINIDGFYDVKTQHEMIKSALKELRPWPARKMISAYTQKPFVEALYTQDKNKYDRGGLVKANGIDIEPDDVTELGYTYDKCGREESLKNKLKIGTLEFTGRYVKGSLQSLDVSKSENLYSNTYENCIRLTLAEFAPKLSDRLKQAYKINDKLELLFRY